MMRFTIVAALAATVGQTPTSAPQATFRAGVELVRLDVSVTRDGRPVRGLSAHDFSIDDRGVRQRVENVTLLDELPVSVIMALDTSGSVAGDKLALLVDAGRTLVAALRPDDRAALVTFSREIRVRVPLSNDRFALQSALADLKGEGPTAIRDAVWVALQLRPDDNSRPLVLVFTDGVDNASWLSRSDILRGVQRAGVVVHAIDLTGDQPSLSVPASGRMARGISPLAVERTGLLEELVRAAGGRRWSATSPRDLRDLFTRAIDEMRARYLVTFYPEGVRRDGWHDLKVSVNGRGTVTAKPGYFVPPRN
jgi:Ca-activated chloride channel homolog